MTEKPNLLAVLKSEKPATKKGGLSTLFGNGSGLVTPRPATASSEWKPTLGTGRLAFVIDATQSREATWQEAKSIQNRMFSEVAEFGDISTRLVHFRGNSIGVFPEHDWSKNSGELADHMSSIDCILGSTQIVRALKACLGLTERPTVIVAIGDCCEESIEDIKHIGRAMKEAGIPIFAFHEGKDRDGRLGYQTLAAESDGVFAKFGDRLDLGGLVVAAAAYSVGGSDAVKQLAQRPGNAGAKAIATQLLALPHG